MIMVLKKMIVVTAKMKVKPEFMNQFMVEAETLIKLTRCEDGCLSYNLYSDTANSDDMIMLEFWEDMECLDSHMESEHFIAFGKAIPTCMDAEIDISKYEVQTV